MKTLNEYLRDEFGYVSKWWKRILLSLVIIKLLLITILVCCYDGSGDLGELYFNFNDRLFYVGFME